MIEIKINIAFKNMKFHEDTMKRSDHIFERMRSRGITTENIKEAVQKGPKKIREDNSIVAEFRWFKVIYREFRIGDIRKIYPITVID
ncbi:MAG: DUF4258 domain-containing protein [Nanoarchaeota archaeon]